MPPKKKVTKAAEEGQPQQQPKLGQKPVQAKKEEQKTVPPVQVNPVSSPGARLDVSAAQSQQQPQPESEQKVQQKAQKIVIDAVQNLTEEERIKLRKLRFGGLGTDNTLEEAERIKQQRLKKFGGSDLTEEKEILQKRKQKFAIAGSAEDDETLKKRKDKFGLGGVLPQENNAIIEERKKKFGNPEATVSLDDEIKKSKPIKKFHHKFNNNKGKWQKGFKN